MSEPLGHCFSTGDNVVPQGPSGKVWRQSDFPNLQGRGRFYQAIEASDPQRTPTTKNSLAPNASSAEGGKPSPRPHYL